MVNMRQSSGPSSPTGSIRKFRNAISPFGSPASAYTSRSEDGAFSGPSSPMSSPSRSASTNRLSVMSATSFRQFRNIIRRKPSTVELEQEEEKQSCADELLCLVEPRPEAPTCIGGIEEVLFGRL